MFPERPHQLDPWAPMGLAIERFAAGDLDASYLAHNAWSGTDEYHARLFFDDIDALCEIERIALELAEGRVCDLGAGAGAHSLALQAAGCEVMAVDSSPQAVQVMRGRGVAQAVCGDYRAVDWSKHDMALMMMNGIGLVGDRAGLTALLRRIAATRAGPFQIIFDASDPDVMEAQLGPPRHALPHPGQVRFQLELDGAVGAPFDWLYIAFAEVRAVASAVGWQADELAADEVGRYLGRLSLP